VAEKKKKEMEERKRPKKWPGFEWRTSMSIMSYIFSWSYREKLSISRAVKLIIERQEQAWSAMKKEYLFKRNNS